MIDLNEARKKFLETRDKIVDTARQIDPGLYSNSEVSTAITCAMEQWRKSVREYDSQYRLEEILKLTTYKSNLKLGE